MKKTVKYGAIDDLRMTYDGNKLSSVVESVPSVLYANSLDLKSGSDEIAYTELMEQINAVIHEAEQNFNKNNKNE
ncbi:MAG TPA: hypothetical protein DCS83_05335 [Prevotella sp.]|nr:hypothetical protein [Prevotella sp.]